MVCYGSLDGARLSSCGGFDEGGEITSITLLSLARDYYLFHPIVEDRLESGSCVHRVVTPIQLLLPIEQ